MRFCARHTVAIIAGCALFLATLACVIAVVVRRRRYRARPRYVVRVLDGDDSDSEPLGGIANDGDDVAMVADDARLLTRTKQRE